MASLLSQLATLIAGPAKPAAAKPTAAKPGVASKPAPPKVKSPERLALEQSILADRRRILANMAQMQKQRAAEDHARGVSDKELMSAAEIARRILLDQGGH
jgi:hypothetical protein